MQNNELMVNQWFNEDKEFLSKNYSLIDHLDKFYAADFKLQEKEGMITILNKFNWIDIIQKNNNYEKRENYSNRNSNYNNNNEESKESKKNNNTNSDKTPVNQNIILKNKILKLKEDSIYLRSLSVECEINLLMSGESNFYIFSRCQGQFSENTAVCCISKELESARKFISFGVLEKKEGGGEYSFKNLKKQEIPKQGNHIKTLDISEIKFDFIDNGDNKCFVFLSEQELLNSHLFLVGDFFVPIDTQSNLMFAVSGDLISIKQLVIKHTFRNAYINHRNNNVNDSVQTCSCCNII